MASFRVFRRAVAVAACVPFALPSPAQDAGSLFTFGIRERLTYGQNLGLEIPSEGRTLRSDTQLSFGYLSETPTQRLAVSGSADLTLADEPGSSGEDFIRSPNISVRYGREGANSALAFDARYRSTEVSTFELGEFIGEDGEIELPEDLGDLVGTGTRSDYNLNGRLDIGTSAPLGFTLQAGTSGVAYSGTSDPSLVDIRRSNVSATARLRFSPVTEGRVTLAYAVYDEDDAGTTHSETRSISAGLTQDLSETDRLNASLGYSVSDIEEFGLTRREQAPVGEISYFRDLPNGSFDAALAATAGESGSRVTLSFGRRMDLPTGSLNARIGASRQAGEATVVIGSLYWLQDLPDGQLNASAVRNARSDSDGIQTVTTALRLGYSHDLTQVAGFNLGAEWLSIMEEGSADVSRTSLTASYRHALTEDWDLNLGTTWRRRNEAGVGQAQSQEYFLSIGREFQWRP